MSSQTVHIPVPRYETKLVMDTKTILKPTIKLQVCAALCAFMQQAVERLPSACNCIHLPVALCIPGDATANTAHAPPLPAAHGREQAHVCVHGEQGQGLPAAPRRQLAQHTAGEGVAGCAHAISLCSAGSWCGPYGTMQLHFH